MGKEGKQGSGRIPESEKHEHISEVSVYNEMLEFLQEHEDKVRQRIIDLLDPWRANNFLALHATPYDEHSYEVIRREPEGYLDSTIYYQRGMANTLVLFLQAKDEQTRVVVLRQVSHSSDYGVQLLKQRMLENTNAKHKHTHSHRKHDQKKKLQTPIPAAGAWNTYAAFNAEAKPYIDFMVDVATSFPKEFPSDGAWYLGFLEMVSCIGLVQTVIEDQHKKASKKHKKANKRDKKSSMPRPAGYVSGEEHEEMAGYKINIRDNVLRLAEAIFGDSHGDLIDYLRGQKFAQLMYFHKRQTRRHLRKLT